MNVPAALNRVLLPLPQASFPAMTSFLTKALSLPLHAESDIHATFVANGTTRLDLVALSSSAAANPPPAEVASPTLVFTVQDLDSCVPLCIQNGATMSSTIKFPAHGKVATVEVEGVKIGLYEVIASKVAKL